MNIYLGNITFDQVREKLGYYLSEKNRIIWDKYHSNSANLSDKDSCFHIFDIPREIHFKGEPAKNAILALFTPERLVEAKGLIKVCERKN